MAKRKRDVEKIVPVVTKNVNGDNGVLKKPRIDTESQVFQIVAGSYERVLHGITASISSEGNVQFSDTFLFNAHTSAIRCLALSPLPEDSSQGIYLATGGSDERVNVYSLSTSPLPESDTKGRKVPVMPTLGTNKVTENPHNRELGALIQHTSNVTALHFPTRSKLLSASEDNTIAISRVRDLTVVSTVKAPQPKVQGQASGDSAPAGATPAGVNDFAIHPSMKLMVSVGRGEKCMRLWNLVTGKKAGVLNFERDILQSVKEGKYSNGEGRKIRWNSTGTEFAVSFERGVAIFGEDSKPKTIVLPQPLTKVHQIHYATVKDVERLAVSTEDGRVIFYDTSNTKTADGDKFPQAKQISQIGGKEMGVMGRIKDFQILTPTETDDFFIVTGSSDGNIKMWQLLSTLNDKSKAKMIGSYETNSRITCLGAFVMRPAEDLEGGLSEFEGLTDTEGMDSSDSD